jgi:pyridoxal phosphate enzyme (YggS family)
MIRGNLEQIQSRIESCDAKQNTTLIAVSKQQNEISLNEALDVGIRIFGENKVQEAITHWANKKELYPDLELHLIGALQSNKASDAVKQFDYIHTIDRSSIIDALSSEMQKQQKNIPCFIQVNTGEEAQKSGVLPKDLNDILNYARSKNVNIIGLMCIPPVGDAAGIHFTFLKKLAHRHGLSELSMGMSNDFETAIKSGATYIRLGTILFGARD